MNLMSCHGFFRKKDPVVILKFLKSMFEYYFSKVFTYFGFSIINLEKLPTEIKVRIHAEDTYNSDKVMICYTKITSTSNTLKNLAVHKKLLALIAPISFPHFTIGVCTVLQNLI